MLHNPQFGRSKKGQVKKETPELYDYFALLNWSFQGCQESFTIEVEDRVVERNFERDLFIERAGGIHRNFVAMLFEIDEACRNKSRDYTDLTRGEMLLFYEQVVNAYPDEVLGEFLSSFRVSAIDVMADQQIASPLSQNSRSRTANHQKALFAQRAAQLAQGSHAHQAGLDQYLLSENEVDVGRVKFSKVSDSK